MMARSDRISKLPVEILDNILGFLPIVEAARTTILSPIWRAIWPNLAQLKFDDHFFTYIENKYSDYYTSTCFFVINKVIRQHNGRIQKFVLDFTMERSIFDELDSRELDLDQLFHSVTQKGVEEINIANLPDQYELPNCIFSCLTLKRLHLYVVRVGPINAPCIFPNVTSLSFDGIMFDPKDRLNCAANVPMLETLSLGQCAFLSGFNITAPRLESLTVQYPDSGPEWDFLPPDTLDLTSIRTICLNFDLRYIVQRFTRRGQRLPELNAEYLKCNLEYDHIIEFIRSLRICPKVCQLEISVESPRFNVAISTSQLLEELQCVAPTLKMLHTLKLSSFWGSKYEMHVIEVLLGCFSTLEKFVIICRWKLESKKQIKIMQDLSCFPCASTKVKFIFI